MCGASRLAVCVDNTDFYKTIINIVYFLFDDIPLYMVLHTIPG